MYPVWMVDDDPDMTEAVRLMLQVLGYPARSFEDAPSAGRALLAGDHPAVFLLDINMPRVSGLELLRFIRTRRNLDGVPVIMLSSEATDVIVEQARTLGAQGYLLKPVMLEEMEAALHEVLKPQSAAI